MMKILPSKRDLSNSLETDDFFLWEYYGQGLLGRIQAWIFRSRLNALAKSLKEKQPMCRTVLDVGCGPMFASYPLMASNIAKEYIKVDVLPADKLKKCRDAMRNCGAESMEAIRASADALPFRSGIFDLSLSRCA
jgi:ubiquinone/menaquinone biosynthesis C-methylase UbiE